MPMNNNGTRFTPKQTEFLQNMFWLLNYKPQGAVVSNGDNPLLVGLQIFFDEVKIANDNRKG
jgi:hypothetical protein